MITRSLQDWSEQLEGLLDRCAAAAEDQCPQRLRETYGVLESGPLALCEPMTSAIGSAELERLLEAGAVESAALRLLANCGYMLSGSGEAHFIASVRLPAASRDFSFNSRSEASAICGAIASAMLETIRPALQDRRDLPGEDR